jgi:hypothetical protein
MTFDEQMRASILAKLTELLGAEEAAALMERVHPEDWSQLATKADLAALREELLGESGLLRRDIDVMRTDIDVMRTDIDVMRTDIDVMRTDINGLRTEFGYFREETRAGFARVDERIDLKLESVEHRLGAQITSQISGLRTELSTSMRDLFVRMVAVMVPAIFSGVGLAFAAAKLS